MAISIAGTVASKLLEQVMAATKIAISCNECCKVLHALLKELQPIVDHAVREISQSNFDNAFKSPRSAVREWLRQLEGTLERAELEVNNCIEKQPDLNPWSRYNTGKRIVVVTESVKKLLQQAGLVGLVVTLSESSQAQRTEKMMQEIHQMIYDLGATAQRIEFATVAQESLQEYWTPSNLQEVPQLVFGLDNFTMRLQQSITSSSTDAKPRCVGVWGMGGAGKTLLAQIAYNSREVREHFKGGKLIWLTVSQTPNIKGLYDSFCRQLGLMPMSFAQLEEYRTRLYNEFLRRRVFLVLDDVWSKGVLEQLDLAKGRGSVTLVTTRNQLVLKKAGVIDEDEVHVGVLSQEDSWKLFCVHAFSMGISNIPCELQGVAELVADECKGLPLALKVIGGLMLGKTTCEEWELQLNCLRESRKLPEQQEEEKLFGRLKLSYDNLDNDNRVCKECFLGFAAFPEDRVVEMEELIILWKGQRLLDDGTKMFGDDSTRFAYYLVGLLVARSLIELAHSQNSYHDSFAYKVHDVMRDLALHIIEGENPITCLYRPGKELVEFPREWIRTFESQLYAVRNLSLMWNDLTTLNDVIFSAPKLEVLLLAINVELKVMPKRFLKGIENLKLLDLSGCALKALPREIGNLRYLTHLNLAACEIRDLKYHPSTVGNLRSLQYLNLSDSSPNGTWGNRSMQLRGQAFAPYICKLTTLTELHISENTCETLELCDQLSKLVSKLVQLKSFFMRDFKKLETLPDAIQSMEYLEEFRLVCCERIKILPSVITLFSKLKVLTLIRMSSLESLPALNTLKMLSTLSISICTSIKKLPDTFTSSDAFPSLKKLDCSNSGLIQFQKVEDGAMPKLQILNLNCPNIKSLPDTLKNLKNLKVV
ncbi:unnamed protein product, partial [Sphagnum compactum]